MEALLLSNGLNSCPWARFRSVMNMQLNCLSVFQASSDILSKYNVISHLYEQITRSLVRIYLGLDSDKVNLWVWVALKISRPN